MKKQTIGIFTVVSISLLLFFQNCGKFETVSLEDEIKFSSVNNLSQSAKEFLGLSCTPNTILSCESNGQPGFKYCENGQFTSCQTQSAVDPLDENLGMQPPVRYTCPGSWTLSGTQCKTKVDNLGTFFKGISTSLYDPSGKNCGYSCECVDNTNITSKSSMPLVWSCTRDGNIVMSGVKGIIGYVPSKILSDSSVTIDEMMPNPQDGNLSIPVSRRQFNAKKSLRYVDVYLNGQITNHRLVFTPIPVDCFSKVGSCTITDQFEYGTYNGNSIKNHFVVYRSTPSEMLAELRRALQTIDSGFDVNFVIRNAFTTDISNTTVNVRILKNNGGTFRFSLPTYFDSGLEDKNFDFFEEIGFTKNILTNNNTIIISTNNYKLNFDKTNAFLYGKSDVDLQQNYFLSDATKIYSLSMVTDSLLLQLEGNLITTSLLSSRQDESYNIVSKDTSIDVAKTNTTCSLSRQVSTDVFEKYMKDIIPSCSDWYMFVYGDGKSEPSQAGKKAIENFNTYSYKVGNRVTDFYLNPNVTRKYTAISTYLMLIEQKADVPWPSLSVPRFNGGRNMTENNMILRQSLGIHPVEMYYKTYGYSIATDNLNLNNEIQNLELEGNDSEACLQSFQSFWPEYLYELKTSCAYKTYKTARLLKYPGVKWSELIYNDSRPVYKVSPDADLSKFPIFGRGPSLSAMIAQNVGLYIIRLPLVRKILVSTRVPSYETTKSRFYQNGKFGIAEIDQGIINIDQAPDFSSLQYEQRKRSLAYPDILGGLFNGFFFDTNKDFISEESTIRSESYLNTNSNYHNYASYANGCTTTNGLFCPAIGSNTLDLLNNGSFVTGVSKGVLDLAYVFNWNEYDISSISGLYNGQSLTYPNIPKLFEYNTEGKLGAWIHQYLDANHIEKHLWSSRNRIIWQIEMDQTSKSSPTITMYYRGFEPRPPGNTMTDTPIPFSVTVDPGYSIVPRD